MLGARHFICRLLILSASTLGFFISSFSTVLVLDFTGPVVSILDGDTIKVLNGHHTDRIHLSASTVPRKAKRYGKHAKQAASDLAFGKDVTVQTHGHDKSGRINR
jgi:micrococcal nuclease